MTKESRAVLAVMAAFAILGIWQHLYFSYSMGELAFFKNAYDEDTYVLNPFGLSAFRPDRLVSDVIVFGLHWILGSQNLVLIAFDVIMLPLIFLSAYLVGAVLFTGLGARLLFAFVLVFSQDMFSLGNVAAYPGPFPTLAHLKALFGEQLVPPIESSYLGIYKSPEPQVSYVIGFAFLALILHVFRKEAISKTQIAALIVLQILLLGSFGLTSYPLFVIEAAFAAILVLKGRYGVAGWLGVLSIISLVPALVFSHSTGGAATFASRMPVVTVGVLSAALLLLVVTLLIFKRPERWATYLAVAAIASIPILISNQQVITGHMISARDFERDINLQLVTVAAGLLLSSFAWKSDLPRVASAAGLAIISIFVVLTSARTLKYWWPDNVKSLELARTIKAAKLPDQTKLVFDEPYYVPTVEARLGHKINAVIDYTEIFKHPIPSTPDFVATDLSRSLFEYWSMRGITPADAEKALRQEAALRGGLYSGFLFTMCEHWAPCTDGRAVKTEKIQHQIPEVIAAYAAYQPSHADFVTVTPNGIRKAER